MPLNVDIAAVASQLKTILSPLVFLAIIPQYAIEKIDGLRDSTNETKAEVPDWGGWQKAPNMLWEAIEPVFRLRDDIVKWVRENLAIPVVKDVAIQISELLDELVFAVLAIYMKPVLENFRDILTIEKNRLTEKDKAAKKELSIFSAGSSCSDPTHSQLSKDHFDNILNPPAGKCVLYNHQAYGG